MLFEYNTAVRARQWRGLKYRALEVPLLECPSSKYWTVGGRWGQSTWLPGGLTICFFSVGQELAI